MFNVSPHPRCASYHLPDPEKRQSELGRQPANTKHCSKHMYCLLVCAVIASSTVCSVSVIGKTRTIGVVSIFS